jgi:hypothetical protein
MSANAALRSVAAEKGARWDHSLTVTSYEYAGTITSRARKQAFSAFFSNLRVRALLGGMEIAARQLRLGFQGSRPEDPGVVLLPERF